MSLNFLGLSLLGEGSCASQVSLLRRKGMGVLMGLGLGGGGGDGEAERCGRRGGG